MSDEPESGEFALALSTSHLLHRAQQLASDRFALLVGENGVTLRQFAVLAAIQEQPGLNQTELVRATGIDRSTLADMVTRMEKRGWISRAASTADARANAVRLAPAGETVLKNALQHAKAADAAILDALPRSKRKSFHATLRRLAAISDEAERKAAEKAKKAARRQARLEARAKEKAARLEAKAKAKAEGGAPSKGKNKSKKKKKKAPAVETGASEAKTTRPKTKPARQAEAPKPKG